MHELISAMLNRYESGQLSRRNLIQALTALAVSAPPASAAESTFKGVGLNHIAVRVTDIPRAKVFYQDMFGLPLISESPSSCFLKMGDEFLTLFKNQNPGLDHYCVAIDDFKPDAVLDRLTKKGLKPRRPNGTDRIYFRDPDGLEVQVSSAGHRA
jgi:catechol 2,3-dioxygenase-like lactoylglutathione lyase family enzyme